MTQKWTFCSLCADCFYRFNLAPAVLLVYQFQWYAILCNINLWNLMFFWATRRQVFSNKVSLLRSMLTCKSTFCGSLSVLGGTEKHRSRFGWNKGSDWSELEWAKTTPSEGWLSAFPSTPTRPSCPWWTRYVQAHYSRSLTFLLYLMGKRMIAHT